MTPKNRHGHLLLGHLLDAAGVDPLDTLVIRHTYNIDGLSTPQEVTPTALIEYTRRQLVAYARFPKNPPGTWLVFWADGARRSRFVAAYDNRGEVADERTTKFRFFDLKESDWMSSLAGRLVVEWSADTINWAKPAERAGTFPVVEIADPQSVPFPGFDQVLLSYRELVAVVEDNRYAAWHTALASVQGIYLIADTSTGQLYVGKADGTERILQRWTTYARDGHGGNVALRTLGNLDAAHRMHFQFSILRVFGPSTPTAEVDAAEIHYKNALLTRSFGLNRN